MSDGKAFAAIVRKMAGNITAALTMNDVEQAKEVALSLHLQAVIRGKEIERAAAPQQAEPAPERQNTQQRPHFRRVITRQRSRRRLSVSRRRFEGIQKGEK